MSDARPATTPSDAALLAWARAACALVALTGLVALGGCHPTTDGPWLLLFDAVRFPIDGTPADFDDDARGLNAVLGGVLVGWSATMFELARARRYGSVVAGTVVWFAADSAGSLVALPGNIILNVIFLAVILPPFWLLHRRALPGRATRDPAQSGS